MILAECLAVAVAGIYERENLFDASATLRESSRPLGFFDVVGLDLGLELGFRCADDKNGRVAGIWFS